MGGIKTRTNHTRAWRVRGWGLSLLGATLVVLALFGGTNAWAASLGERPNQTVPQPTPTSPATAVPTVTPTSPPPPTDTPQPPTATSAPSNPPPTATSQPDAPTATHTSTATPPPTATPTPQPTATEVPGFALQAQMDVVSGLAMQGDEAEIRLLILNPGSTAAHNVMVRDELPDGLQVIAVEAAGGTASTKVGSNGRTVALFTWPALEPGLEAQATLTVRIDPNLADGVVIDNLAVAYADNAGPATVGVSIGMPPVLLPTFD